MTDIGTGKKNRMDIWATMTLKDNTGNELSVALIIENKIYSSEGKFLNFFVDVSILCTSNI